jgi:hypothetical protein
MNEKTYYVDQVPAEALVFTVKDEARKPRSLAAYSGAAVFFTNPLGLTTSGGTATITDAANGEVTFTFPATTLFPMQGQYRVQLKLLNGEREDYTDILNIRVVQALEGSV